MPRRIYPVFVFIILLIFFTVNLAYTELKQNVIEVDINGSGDYETIQQGINAAGNGDLVLVFPGAYYENVNYLGKNITLASKYYTTGDESYIDNTIIDGNNNGSCVSICTNETDVALVGFTIQHGSGTTFTYSYGGGVYIHPETGSVDVVIDNCIIQENTSQNGGGIFISNPAVLDLSATKIRNNYSKITGGGIHSGGYDTINFDQDDLCDIYYNYAPLGSDIYNNIDDMTVYLDTFTVANPTQFYTYEHNDEITIDSQNNKIEKISHDLYVSPDGENSNSGLTPAQPLQNIYDALIKINSQGPLPYTIHLAEGTYSPTQTGELFPLGGKDNVSIIGAGKNETILDAENTAQIFTLQRINSYLIKKITIKNGRAYRTGGVSIFQNCKPIIEDVICINNNCIDDYGESHIKSSDNSNIIFKNTDFLNTQEWTMGEAISLGGNSFALFENCTIRGNKTIQQPGRNFGAVALMAAAPVFVNCEITDNYGQITSGISSTYSGISDEEQVYLINCTIADNDHCYQGTIRLTDNSHITLINTILRNEPYTEIFFHPSGESSSATLEYCNVDNGINAINTNNNGNVYYAENNIDEDPQFVGGDPINYQLTEDSPCIDAGTPQTTGLNLPDTDLAGQPRIYNRRVDIGAYEYIPNAAGEEADTSFVNKLYLYQNQPNPFSTGTEILFITTDYERVEDYDLSIYNTKGQLVRRYEGRANNFKFKTRINWDGKDSQGREVAPGTYFYKLEYNGNSVVRKMAKVK